jgi:hypothetical protein
MEDQIVAGAQDAAKELGYRITASSVRHQQDEDSVYRFAFDARGLDASVEFMASEADVLRSGLTPRDWARHEILDGLREPPD